MTHGKDIIDANNGFVRLSYLIDQSGWAHSDKTPKRVDGYAFETPGWPDFHACVRWDRYWPWSDDLWIIDHYESGRCINRVAITDKEEAPAAVAKLLSEMGAERVSAAIAPFAAGDVKEIK